MNLWLDEVDYTEYPEEINPELIDERLITLLGPSIPFSKEKHQVLFYKGTGFIL
jgi:hypothetical protein